MCRKCVESGIMTPEELDAIDASLGSEPESIGDLISRLAGSAGSGAPPDLSDVATGLRRNMVAEMLRTGGPAAVAQVTSEFFTMLETAGWGMGLVVNSETGNVGIGISRLGEQTGNALVLMEFKPDEIRRFLGDGR